MNLALKTTKDLIALSQDQRGSGGLIYCSVMQVYLDEVTDLLQLPKVNKNGSNSGKKGTPYFTEHQQQLSNCGQSLIIVNGQIF